MMPSRRALRAGLALVLSACASPAARTSPSPVPGATAPAITAADLRHRVHLFAHDSMLGRQAGREGHDRAVAYLAAELARLGLAPAGEGGTFFQSVPLVRRVVDPRSSLVVDGRELALWTEYAPALPVGAVRDIDGARVVFGGATGDSVAITAEQAAGKIVLLASPPGAGGLSLRSYPPGHPLAGAVAIAITGLDAGYPRYARNIRDTTTVLEWRDPEPLPATLLVPTRTAELLMGRPLDGLLPGAPGRVVRGRVAQLSIPSPSRNVVAVLPGADPGLRGQYVAVGAHSDHLGIAPAAVDHDSLHAFRAEVRRIREAGGGRISNEQFAAIRVNVDSLRTIRPARRDSIFNGADDDASGSMALLEIAEALATARERPRRSVLFVWHTAEEMGLTGARWFTERPMVPRDSIVAMLNLDMLGRGGAGEIAGGGPAYLQLIGARRLSTPLGDVIERANAARARPFRFDYAFDAEGHPESVYCRSDHAMYARFGIPVAFLTTGSHGDYHQVTDEAQYLDYPKLAEVTRLVLDAARRLADLDRRPTLDRPRPDPAAPCRQ